MSSIATCTYIGAD